ncbi:F-box protein [Hirschfeldia incana]|nr:F-box protein [Hirschfeldia incana]
MAFSNGSFSKFHGKEEALGLGFVRTTRGLGRKRILISKSNQENVSNSDQNLLKRSKSETTESNNSVLESLHQDILIRVLCHVDHDDLARLKRVSKTIRNAVSSPNHKIIIFLIKHKLIFFFLRI